MIRRLLLLSIFVVTSVVAAQETSDSPPAQGAIQIPRSGNSELSLNPLFCRAVSDTCDLLSSLLFPTLTTTNPVDGSLALANETNFALLADYDLSADGDHYIYTLREDAQWSDGTPITAYDVLFSYLAIISRATSSHYSNEITQHLQGMIPIDDSTLMVIPEDIDCDLPLYANFPVVPAHEFDEDFRNRVASHFSDNILSLDSLEDWIDQDGFAFNRIVNHPFSFDPTVTYGHYTFAGQSDRDYLRLAHVNGQQVIETVVSQRGQSGIDDVIAGDIAYYTNPPQNEWQDLRNNPHVNTITLPTNTWYYLVFNFASTVEPLSYRDNEGEIQEQDPHRILINPDVRQAIQLGIDVQAIVDDVLWGEGEVMAGYSLPHLWTHNPDLDPIGYDPDLAAELLEATGWRRLNRSSARVCIGCETTTDNSRLFLRLAYDDTSAVNQRVASHIARQLRRINIEVEISGAGFGNMQSQQFDMYLGRRNTTFPVTVEESWFFSPENDVLGTGVNIGSYNNPEVTTLYHNARTVNGCDINIRRELYYELEQQVQADLPSAWLFTPYQIVVFHESIQNVEIYPNQPIVNIHEWSVWRIE